MDLYQGQVPSDEVYAVVMDAPPGSKDVSWFITSEAASQDYREVVDWIKVKGGGTAERWIVALPGQRMEAEAVTIWVEALLLPDEYPRPEHARRLDVFKR
jgi:hypothetical protein